MIYYNNNNQTETIDDLTWLVNNVKSKKADAYMVGEGWTTYREYAKYYKSGIDSMFNFDFSQQDGYIGKVLNGAANHGASTYGNALVDVENEIKKYTDSYIDAPFIQIMIWDAAQDTTTEIMPRRKPRWRRL